MKNRLITLILVCTGLSMLAGCGGGGLSSSADKIAESNVCIGCHEQSAISSVTGKPIVTEFQQSLHFGKVSCNDCHEQPSGHPFSCSGCHGTTTVSKTSINPSHNPMNPNTVSAATASHPEIPAHKPKCFKCHFLPTTAPPAYPQIDNMTAQVRLNHMSTSRGRRGNYLPTENATLYSNSCSRCHNPHDNSAGMPQAREWAKSGKGDVLAGPWVSNEFRLNNIAAAAYNPNNIVVTDSSVAYNQCVRCHTTTGYRNYIGHGSAGLAGKVAPFGGAALSQGRETLFCDACHSDYSFKRRTTGPVTVFYTLSTNTVAGTPAVPIRKIRINGENSRATFQDIGTSNLCLYCHTGRETGNIIKLVSNDPTVSFNRLAIILSHYLTGGSSLLQSNGYEFSHLDPSRTYPTSGHKDVGGTLRGPCITCHMDRSRHGFEPLSTNKVSLTNFWQNRVKGLTNVCSGCHSGRDAAYVDNRKIVHRAALDAIMSNMTTKYGLRPGQANNIRSFTPRGSNSTFVNWSSRGATPAVNIPPNSSPVKGRDLMGAAFNWVALMNDYGSYVHNVPYAKKLIYDTIDLLDNGVLDYSTCGRLNSSGKVDAFSYLCPSGVTGSSTERP